MRIKDQREGESLFPNGYRTCHASKLCLHSYKTTCVHSSLQPVDFATLYKFGSFPSDRTCLSPAAANVPQYLAEDGGDVSGGVRQDAGLQEHDSITIT